MFGKPEDKELEEMILHDMGAKDPNLLHKIIILGEKVHTKGTELGKKDCMSRISYRQWVLERVKVVTLLFFIEIPPRPATPESIHVSLKEVKELRAKVDKIGKENLVEERHSLRRMRKGFTRKSTRGKMLR